MTFIASSSDDDTRLMIHSGGICAALPVKLFKPSEELDVSEQLFKSNHGANLRFVALERSKNDL